MIQNLKVDIIYHSTPSDFEMEFNLCGCCRMRLLSDKTTDKKGFIKALARDVSRSRVIIACGPLFNTDGLICTVATAIGSGLDTCDNKLYGINSNDEIKIIRGSTPLVTPDGYFGGCIIESGPQTIILLTENKAFRKAIMQTLIHPYIEEICYIPTASISAIQKATNTAFEPAVSENEEYIVAPEDDTEVDDILEESPSASDEYIIEPEQASEDDTAQEDTLSTEFTSDEHTIAFVMDSEPEDTSSEAVEPDLTDAQSAAQENALPTGEPDISFVMNDEPESEPLDPEQSEPDVVDDSYNLMYTEVETQEEIKSRYEDPYKPSESDNMFLISDEDDYGEITPKKKSSTSMNIAIVILVLLLLLAVLAIVYFVILEPASTGVSIGEHAKQIFGFSGQSSSV